MGFIDGRPGLWVRQSPDRYGFQVLQHSERGYDRRQVVSPKGEFSSMITCYYRTALFRKFRTSGKSPSQTAKDKEIRNFKELISDLFFVVENG